MRALAVLVLLVFSSSLSAQNLLNNAYISALQMTAGASPTFFAGTPGGMYVSSDEMQSWTPVALTDDFTRPQPGISQILRDPSNSGSFYAAGGAHAFQSQRPAQGVEIYRTDDLGQTWTSKVSGIPADAGLNKIYVAESQPGTLYALVTIENESRVYKSTNRADSWTLLRTLPAGADEVAIQPTNPNLWYYETGRGIFRSSDEGATFAAAGAFPLRALGRGGLENTVTDILTIPGSDNLLVMGTNGPVFGGEDFDNGLFFSDDRGSNWQRKLTGGIQQLHFDGALFIYRAESASLWISNDGGRTVPEPYDLGPPGSAEGFLVDRRDSSVIYSGFMRSADRGRTWSEIEGSVTPFIGVDEGLIEVSGSTNDVAPRVLSFQVEALGSSTWNLPYNIESSAPWVAVSSSEGTTPDPVTVRVSAGGLPIGVQQATLTIRSPEAPNTQVQVQVRLTVSDQPAADPSPTILTYAGNGDFGDEGDGGPAVEAELEGPAGLAADGSGGLYIADSFADRVRYVNAAGVISAFAGSASSGFSGDGGPAAQASLDSPRGIAIGAMGEVYIADRFNRRVRVVNPGGQISTFAGDGEFGSNAAAGNVADLHLSPTALAATPDGGLMISGGGTFRVNPDGGYVRWSSTSYEGLAVAPDGKIYGARRHLVEEIRPGNFTRVVAGGNDAGYAGDGGPAAEALLNGVEGLAFDQDGRMFISDSDNHVVRMVDGAGVISTYAGTGIEGSAGDGGPANLAELDNPEGLAVGPNGELYIAESRRIRVVQAPGQGGPAPVLSSAGIVSAASFTNSEIAPNQIISLFGQNFGSQVAVATQTPLPTSLGGVRAELIDSAGATHAMPLFFVAPGQINALAPDGVATGLARLRVIGPDGQAGEASIQVVAVAPGLFSANATGEGVAAAAAIHIAADGAQTPVQALTGANPVQGLPLDLGSEGEQMVLLLFGTGFRGFTSSVEVTIGGVAATVVGVAAQPEFVGLDQLNVIVPRELAGRGEVEVRVTIDGKLANVVTIVIG